MRSIRLPALDILSSSETEVYLGSLEYLFENTEDISFRAYDLLFAIYPELEKSLPLDRYTHPEFLSLLSPNEKSIRVGFVAIDQLVNLMEVPSQRMRWKVLVTTRKSLTNSIRDVLASDISRDVVSIYTRLLDRRYNLFYKPGK